MVSKRISSRGPPVNQAQRNEGLAEPNVIERPEDNGDFKKPSFFTGMKSHFSLTRISNDSAFTGALAG